MIYHNMCYCLKSLSCRILKYMGTEKIHDIPTLDIVFVDQKAEGMIVIVQMMKDDAKYIIVSALIS